MGLTYGLFEEGGIGPYHRAKVSDGMDQPGLSIDANLRRVTFTKRDLFRFAALAATFDDPSM
jgi:hypothetical protein